MKSLRTKILVVLFITIAGFATAQTEKYKRARIWLDGKSSLELAKTGVDLLESVCKKNVYYESDFSESELKRIEKAGFRIEILIEDVQEFYQERNSKAFENKSGTGVSDCNLSPEYPKPAHFYLGSMGGYFTYQQLLNNLDSMAILYPNLITAKQPVNAQTTVEGRALYYLRLSDNPNIDEPEPEVLYTALHHAREPNSMAAVVYYMWYLLENYATDTNIQNLVNNTEMYFVPCVNPDGYVYNETTNPNGAGFWRKNRHDFTNGIFGVDLNRNYGLNWGYDNLGSSPNSTVETYRGDSAFSEAETQMMRDFCLAHNFKLTLNYHAFGNYVVHPWGHIPNYSCPDSAVYKAYGKQLTKYNLYKPGTPNQTLNYLVNGGAEDWMYGEQSLKPKIIAMLPEVGTGVDGFWPTVARVIPICKENMYPSFMAARFAGRYGIAEDKTAKFITAQNAFLKFDFTLLGLDTTGNYTVSIVPLSTNIMVGSPKVYSGLNLLQVIQDSISVSYFTGILTGDPIDYLISVNNGIYTLSDTIHKFFASPTIEFYDDGSSVANWFAFNLWGTSSATFVSAPSSITDSPIGNYLANGFNELFLNDTINLVNASRASLTFNTRWEIENNFDYAQIQVSTDGGNTWLPLCGKYTTPGSLWQDAGNPIYDGNQYSWVKEEISLDAYAGLQIMFRFLLVSDGSNQFDGFYFDDFKVEKISSSGVGIDESHSAFSISIFPNPATESFTLNYSSNTAATFKLYDVFGKQILTIPLSSKQQERKIDCTNLSKGIYFYRVENENAVSRNYKLLVR